MNLEELTKGKPLKLTEEEVVKSLIKILGDPNEVNKEKDNDK